MIKFDMLHIYHDNKNDVSLNGITFKQNGKTNNNEENKESLISYIGETSLAISDNIKIKKEYDIKNNDELYMITFLCSNVKELYNKLKKDGIKVTTPTYSTRINALLIPCKTKFQYMYVNPFKDSKFKICFREIDTSTDLLNYQKAMIPNSAEKDIVGVKEIKLFLDLNNNDLENLLKIFDNSYLDGNEFSTEIYQNQTLTIINSKEEKAEILFEVRGKVFKGKEINIKGNNEEKRNITFIY